MCPHLTPQVPLFLQVRNGKSGQVATGCVFNRVKSCYLATYHSTPRTLVMILHGAAIQEGLSEYRTLYSVHCQIAVCPS